MTIVSLKLFVVGNLRSHIEFGAYRVMYSEESFKSIFESKPILFYFLVKKGFSLCQKGEAIEAPLPIHVITGTQPLKRNKLKKPSFYATSTVRFSPNKTWAR